MGLAMWSTAAPVLVCLACAAFFAVAKASLVASYETRNAAVISKLQAQLESLQLYEDTLPLGLTSDDQQLTFALGGSTYTCKLDDRLPKPVEPEFDRSSVEAVTSQFHDLCLVLPQNWWNYEYCFRKEIRQFHAEQPAAPGGGEVVRDPDWSLGFFNHSVVYRLHNDNDNPEAPIRRIHDFYVGGQMCDENEQQRSVEVQMKCCEPRSNQRSSTKHHQTPPGMVELARITSITEPSLCSYRMVVCNDRLCDPVPDKQIALLTELMKEMNNTCVIRQEDWWTYELCIGKGIRQYHAEMEKDSKGRQKPVVKSEYVLGNAPVDLYHEEEVLRSLLSTQKQGDGLPVLLLDFLHGTPCGAEAPIDRSTTVEISCGPKELLVDVIEDRTCHYRAKMTSPLLCEHPEFEATQHAVKSIQCTESSEGDESQTESD